ncbi:hypothetical protein NEUTE2DRAFT_72811 [Neurospora tetrasperma FGSC 2509]|nr:hypothetical protein NEUTE2DRAFT_72811 [Neurospora tetrasperma FGSC 2509]
MVGGVKWGAIYEKKEKNDQVIELILRTSKRRNFGGKNGIFNIRCHPADRSTF